MAFVRRVIKRLTYLLTYLIKVTRFKMFGWIHQNFGYADRKVW